MNKKFLLTVLFIFCAGSLSAETIILKSGQTVKGKIQAQTSDYIKVDMGLGTPITYYLEDIAEIKADSEPAPAAAVKKLGTEAKPPVASEETPPQEKQSLSDMFMPKKSEQEILTDRFYSESTTRAKPSAQAKPETNAEETEENVSVISLEAEQARKIAYKIRDDAFSLKDKMISFLEKLRPIKIEKKRMIQFVIIFVIHYLLLAFPFYLISKKLLLKNWSWLAWVPLLQIILMVKMGEKPLIWSVLLFVPVLNIFLFLAIWFKISEVLQKPRILGLFMLLPVINFAVVWYLAYSKIK